MIPEFKRLDDHEIELMLKAPILACILIAGADGEIDRNEVREAIELAKESTNKTKDDKLFGYYQLVAEDFEDKLKILLQGYPFDQGKRTPVIVNELSALNQVLPKLSGDFAKGYYDSLRNLALKIAESSGGLLGIKSVGEEEAKLVDLPMITNPSKA
ncbi:MAG: hypothetical protein RIB47_15180 [Cyclobacteriaceae bacterium]